METFSALLAFVRGSHRLPVNSPHKGQWRVALVFSLICAGTNGWANHRDAGNLRRRCANYDVTVMLCFLSSLQTMKELKDYFCTSIMEKLEKHSERTVLLLDSLDQLRDFGCKLRGWIPTNLPENVTLLLSCIPAEEFVVGPELKVRAMGVNSLSPERFEWKFRSITFKLSWVIGIWNCS